MPSGSGNGGGLFSSITSLFSSANLGEGSSSSSSGGKYLDRKRSVGGLPTTMRRGPPRSLDDDDPAWRLPYGQYGSEPNTASSTNGIYPPSSASPLSSNFNKANSRMLSSNGGESTATLVPGAQSRTSLSLSTNVSIPSTAYPPLKHTWRRIRSWCNKNYTELADTLNWPATEAQLDDLELTIGFALPPAVRDSYLCYDGQELESNQSCSDGLFFGLPLLSLDQIAEEWRFWRNVDDDPSTGANPEVKGWMCSCPAGWVRPEYSCRGWIPLITDRVGNYVGVDLSPNPGNGGSPGQVILFGRDFDTKIVLWRGEGEGGWGRFLQYIAEEFESGEIWTLEEEHSNDSNDEEDAIGYESYFSGGGSGAGRGGGDRGGDGAAGFKLKGEYKGWPVLEAWADRSMRCWEEIGMPAGQPAWRSDHQQPPSVVLPGDQLEVDENGESFDAESSMNAAHRYQDAGSGSNSSSTTAIQGPTKSDHSHPLESSSPIATPSTPNLDEGKRTADTLSPPPMHTPRFRQKQREDPSSDTLQQQLRPRKPVPAPAASLDLPTIDDVRAAHAAAMASQLRSGGNYHYDMENGARPPAGMGGMGMGMGMRNNRPYASRDEVYDHGSVPYAVRRSDDVRVNLSRDDDGVELDNRTSTEGLYSTQRNNDAALVNYNDSNRGSQTNVNSLSAPSIGAGRTLFAASRSSEAVDNLIDASSSSDVSIQIEGTRAAANQHGGNTNNIPSVSSPLASQVPIFGATTNDSFTGDVNKQPLTA